MGCSWTLKEFDCAPLKKLYNAARAHCIDEIVPQGKVRFEHIECLDKVTKSNICKLWQLLMPKMIGETHRAENYAGTLKLNN